MKAMKKRVSRKVNQKGRLASDVGSEQSDCEMEGEGCSEDEVGK